MNVLLLSMPDSFEHMPSLAIRMPNGGLTSIAGNVDPHHRVAVADLILVQRSVRETVTRLVRDMDPEVVGLSIMTFQRPTAARIIELVRSLQARRKDRGGWIRSQPRSRSVRIRSRLITWSAARGKSRSGSCCAHSRITAGRRRLAVCPIATAIAGCTIPVRAPHRLERW